VSFTQIVFTEQIEARAEACNPKINDLDVSLYLVAVAADHGFFGWLFRFFTVGRLARHPLHRDFLLGDSLLPMAERVEADFTRDFCRGSLN